MDEILSAETMEFEIQTDILTLLENVKCQGSNPSGLKQALLALATICSSGTVSQEYFYMAGGVEELKVLLLEGSCSLSAVPAALYCLGCAVRQNVTSQNEVLTEDMLTMIHELLSHADSSDKIIQATAFLLACSVAGSSKGQLMANETGCLKDLVHLLRQCITSGCNDESKWSVVIRAIGVCVNNPLNVHNQQICCSVLPHILKFIDTAPRHQCASHSLMLIGFVVSNNVPNQDRVRRCGGIETLVQFITKQVSVKCISLSLLANAASAIDACIADNEESGKQAGNLGLVCILLELLQKRDLELSQTQIFILTLAHVLESSSEYCQLVAEGKGYHILINVLTDSQDEELCKVIKYIFTLCKNKETSIQKNRILNEENVDEMNHPARDLTSSLREEITALSDHLNAIEKLSENIHWMKAVDTNLSVNNSEFQNDTHIIMADSGNSTTQYNMFEETAHTAGNQDILKQNKFNNTLCYTPKGFASDVFNQGLNKGIPPSVSSGFSGCRSQSVLDVRSQIVNAENGTNHTDYRSNRITNNSSKHMPVVDFLEQQVNCQVQCCQDIENRKNEHSQIFREELNQKHFYHNMKIANQRGTSLNRAQSQHKDEQKLQKDFVSYTPHCGTVNDHCQEFNLSDCTRSSLHQRKKSSVSSKHDGFDCLRRTQTNKPAPSVLAAGQVTAITSISSQPKLQCINQAQTSSVHHGISLNSCKRHRGEESFIFSKSPKDSQFYLLAKLKKVIASFFRTHIPEQADSLPVNLETSSREFSEQFMDHGSLERPSFQTPDEQHDKSIYSSAASENILSVYERKDVPLGDTHQQIFYTKSGNQTLYTKQFENDKVREEFDNELLENLTRDIIVAEKSDLGNNSEMEKYVSTKVGSTTRESYCAEEERLEKAVMPLNEHITFAKPSHPPPCRSQTNKANQPASNIRLAGTPLTSNISAKTAENQDLCQSLPSPALSQFDSYLKKMAQLSTKNYSKSAARTSTTTEKVGISTCESKSTSLTSVNMAPSSPLSKSNTNHTVNDKLISNKPSCTSNFIHPRNMEAEPIPLYRKNVTRQSKEQHHQPENIAKAIDGPYKPSEGIKKRYEVRKGLRISNPGCSKNSLCPGCTAGLNLNSYTYNFAIETSVHTCSYHQMVRQCERKYIHQQLNSRSSVNRNTESDNKHSNTNPQDVYDYQSDSRKSSATQLTSSYIQKGSKCRKTSVIPSAILKQDEGRECRRPRVLYTHQELLNLFDGVAKMGKRWQQILCTYQFHPCRTAVDLKDKYKQLKMKKKEEQQVKTGRPFSMCEVRRLKNGVKCHGYNWKAILKSYRFLPGRTAEDLHNQWRSLNQIKVH